MPSPPRQHINFSGRIPRTSKLALAAILPMQGGQGWLVETTMRQFLDLVEAHPTIQTLVHDQIQTMIGEGRPDEEIVDLMTRLPMDLYRRFDRLFPERGATTWFLRTLVANFLQQAENHPLPEDLAQFAVLRMVKQ